MTDHLTRRDLLRRAALGGAALAAPGLLGVAGARGATTRAGAAPGLASSLTISNWPLYIDVDAKTKTHPTLGEFTKRYGVKIKYIEDINDNDQFFGKIQAQLSHGQSIGRDIIVLTDWMAARLVRLGWLERLDKAAIPNRKNILPALAHPKWDQNRDYSMPWQSGMTGIGYDPKRVKGEVSVDRLLTDRSLRGKVTLLTEMPDTIGLVMLSNGDDPSKVTPQGFDRALAKIKQAVGSGQIRQFTGNDYAPLLAKGDVWAAFAWSGDIVQLQLDHPGLKFAVPGTGGMIWADNMLIPKRGDAHTASVYMNYVYDPRTEAKIEAYVNYISPVTGVQGPIARIDKSLARNELIFPSAGMLSRVHLFDAGAADDRGFKQKFQQLIGA